MLPAWSVISAPGERNHATVKPGGCKQDVDRHLGISKDPPTAGSHISCSDKEFDYGDGQWARLCVLYFGSAVRCDSDAFAAVKPVTRDTA